jgi:signal transduction histidine kinase/ActR/RegA family two-component response regulator
MILAVIVLTSLVVSGSTVAITAVSFWRDLQRVQLEQFEDYVAERGRINAALFERMAATQTNAIAALDRRLATLDDDFARAEFDRLFPLQDDGTRRSIDPLFEGYAAPDGDTHFGVGAYLNPEREWDLPRKRLLVAAYLVVDRFGEALQGLIDNIYFFSDDNELVISAPARPDRLAYYRREAPAGFDMREASFFPLVLPENNPEGLFVCDELAQLLYVQTGEWLTTGCFTPYRRNGEHRGAFGTTVELRTYFGEAMANPPAYGENMIIDANGNLIAHAALLAAPVTPQAVEAVSQGLDTSGFLHAIEASGQPHEHGVVATPNGHWIIGYTWLDGPGWYSISRIDRDALRQEQAGRVLVVILIGIAGVALQCLLAYLILFNRLVRPLAAMTRHFGTSRPDAAGRNPALTRTLQARNELGTLARRLEAQRRRNEEMIDQLEDRVAERTRELEVANQAKSEFLANMSHEIRTPLNGVLGLAQIIELRAKDPNLREQARMIHDSGEMLTALLNDILDMSKIEAGKLELAPAATDLRTVLFNLKTLFEGEAQAKGLDFTVNIDAGIPAQLSFDPLRVKQCVSNLLSNAIKFTETGSVRLTAHAECEEASGETGGTCLVTISIADTGMGMEPDVLDGLFAPFTQASASIGQTHGGTGLGLAITRNLAEIMDGGVTVRSTPGRGAVFTLTFRAATVKTAAGHQAREAPSDLAAAPEFAPLRGRNILLVEDNHINQQVATAFLAPLKGRIHTAMTGVQALERLADSAFDIVIMDVRMPVMDGLEAISRIRSSETAYAGIPVVALTANASEEDARICLQAGMDAYVSKPLKPKALYNAMLTALSRSSARR